MTEAARYVSPTAAGVLAWLTRADASPERSLLTALLDCAVPLDSTALARRLAMPVPRLARLLFALNRSQHLQVELMPPRQPADGLASALAAAAMQLAASRPLVLGDGDGLCLLGLGCSADEADRAAAGRSPLPRRATLHLPGLRLTLYAAQAPAPDTPAWVALARSLTRCAAAPLSATPPRP